MKLNIHNISNIYNTSLGRCIHEKLQTGATMDLLNLAVAYFVVLSSPDIKPI